MVAPRPCLPRPRACSLCGQPGPTLALTSGLVKWRLWPTGHAGHVGLAAGLPARRTCSRRVSLLVVPVAQIADRGPGLAARLPVPEVVAQVLERRLRLLPGVAVPQVTDRRLGLAAGLAVADLVAQVLERHLCLARGLAVPQVTDRRLGLAARVALAGVVQRRLRPLRRLGRLPRPLRAAQPRGEPGPPFPKHLLQVAHRALLRVPLSSTNTILREVRRCQFLTYLRFADLKRVPRPSLPPGPIPVRPGNMVCMSSDRRTISGHSPFEQSFGYSRAVVVDGRVIVAGTAPIPADGSPPPDGAFDQAMLCLEVIGEALTKAGASFADVVRTRMFLTNPDNWS